MQVARYLNAAFLIFYFVGDLMDGGSKYAILKNEVNSDIFLDSKVYRIIALKDIIIETNLGKLIVKKGDLGGFVEDYHNLSQKGSSWIFDNAIACKDAQVSGNAILFDEAVSRGKSCICGCSVLCNEVCIYETVTIADKRLWISTAVNSDEMLDKVIKIQEEKAVKNGEDPVNLKLALRIKENSTKSKALITP